ncbi:MAG: methyl-accepting chemotaxis protein [Acidimicrobiales bacterium]
MTESPRYEAIVNSNSLGVAFISRAQDNRVSFLSRHAVRRFDELDLLGRPAASLIGEPARTLADIELFSDDALASADRYPAVVQIQQEGRELELAISPVFDLDDTYLGVMVTFRDRSDDARRAADTAQFQEHIGELVARAGSQGSEAEQVGEQLGQVATSVQENGADIRRLLDQFANLNKQAKLLALNASIEVHRTTNAEAFGIVATEMQELASRMAAVADEVDKAASRINGLSVQVHDASESITDSIGNLVTTQRSMEASFLGRTDL